MITYLAFFLSLVSVGVLGLVFIKIKRIHFATCQLLALAKNTNKETQSLYKQLQAFMELSSLLEFPMPLPALRGWAVSPDILLEVSKHILIEKPKVVLECSSGSSTLVAARCLQMNGAGRVYSLEHDAQYAKATRVELERQGLDGWAKVIDAPLDALENQPGQLWYSLAGLPLEAREAELLLIDGPPQATCSLARYPAIPQLKDLLAPKATIFLDDADRPDEREAVKRWLEENPGWVYTQVFCEKGCAKIYTGK